MFIILLKTYAYENLAKRRAKNNQKRSKISTLGRTTNEWGCCELEQNQIVQKPKEIHFND